MARTFPVAMAIAGGACSASAQPVMTPIPWSFTPVAIRADGAMLAGENGDFTTVAQPATWSRSIGVQLFPVPPGTTSGVITGLSHDGSTAVGGSSFNGSWATNRATVWQNGVPVALGYLSGGQVSSATAVSGDGSVAAGWSYIDNTRVRAFRWTAAGGMQDLGTISGRNSTAVGISADGAVIAGNTSDSGPSSSRPFRWTAAGGMQDLGLHPNATLAWATAMSADGTAITGFTDFQAAGGNREYGIFRWSESLGTEYLGSLGLPFAERTETEANAISASGDVIVGQAFDVESGPGGFGGFTAVLWSRATGLVDLNTYLPTLGLDLGGYSLQTADAISADGSIIAGTGFGPDGSFATWMVSGVPAPSSLVMLAMGASLVTRRTRARSAAVLLGSGANGVSISWRKQA